MTAPDTARTTVGYLVGRFKARIAATLALVVLEAAALLLFPLFIGRAIDGLLDDRVGDLWFLGALGVFSLAIGALRRLIDTRTYASIYETTAVELVESELGDGNDVSTIAARTTLLTEFIEFLENSMPAIVNSVIAVVGTLVILAGIHLGVFVASLFLAILVGAVYAATGTTNLELTSGYNDELERQVAALSTRTIPDARNHFTKLMTWNRKLSDLETFNYTLIYLGVIALLIYSPIAVVGVTTPEYGFVFASMMYVFQYVESILAMPLFIQQLIRLNEISDRLSSPRATSRDVGTHELKRS